jgi:hypothetical protein
LAISERCSCGATIDTVPGLEIGIAARLVRDWRKSHRHGDAKAEDQRKPMGFNTQSVSNTANDGEGDEEWQGMYASPDA